MTVTLIRDTPPQVTTWPGKVGRQVGDEYEPGWRGTILESPGFCDHWGCCESDCGHPDCQPPF